MKKPLDLHRSARARARATPVWCLSAGGTRFLASPRRARLWAGCPLGARHRLFATAGMGFLDHHAARYGGPSKMAIGTTLRCRQLDFDDTYGGRIRRYADDYHQGIHAMPKIHGPPFTLARSSAHCRAYEDGERSLRQSTSLQGLNTNGFCLYHSPRCNTAYYFDRCIAHQQYYAGDL